VTWHSYISPPQSGSAHWQERGWASHGLGWHAYEIPSPPADSTQISPGAQVTSPQGTVSEHAEDVTSHAPLMHSAKGAFIPSQAYPHGCHWAHSSPHAVPCAGGSAGQSVGARQLTSYCCQTPPLQPQTSGQHVSPYGHVSMGPRSQGVPSVGCSAGHPALWPPVVPPPVPPLDPPEPPLVPPPVPSQPAWNERANSSARDGVERRE
jgi:hypothetical protein